MRLFAEGISSQSGRVVNTFLIVDGEENTKLRGQRLGSNEPQRGEFDVALTGIGQGQTGDDRRGQE